MRSTNRSRREFLGASGWVFGSAWLGLNLPAVVAVAEEASRAHEAGAPFQTLTAEEARELAAIAERIFPSDDTPGAREAGVIYFIDRALGSIMADYLVPIRAKLAELLRRITVVFPEIGTFSGLSPERQLALLRGIEGRSFFESMRTLTLMGMFTLPKYGGNRDKIGWKVLGFEDRHQWSPPFGYYDAQTYEEDSNDA